MASDTEHKLRTHEMYTVGWVCALPKEQTAAIAMLDQRHSDLPKPPNDPNKYTLGSVGKHNVVIACLPKGQIGNSPAATAAAWMISTFPSIKVGLMVGIGGGIPPKARLGDVVVSIPVGQFPGVVQWDFGKANEGGNFERTGALNNPPISLLTALTTLETEHDLTGSKIPEYLEGMKEKWPKLAAKYLKSDSLEDVLFRADYSHVSGSTTDYETTTDIDEDEEESCRFCDPTKVVMRKPRDMRVHYGLIASGNQVIKDAAFRDRLNRDLGGKVLCIEMEAAGLMNNFPCIVIRGICDYADSHKNKAWQEHAAAVAAACAKELLGYVQPSDVDGESTVKDILNQVEETRADIRILKSHIAKKEDYEILEWLTPVTFGPQHSDYLGRRQPGTGQWLLDTAEFKTWLKTEKQTLFCPGIPGSGKTILTAILIDKLIADFGDDKNIGVAYLYCNYRRKDEQRLNDLLASLLKQLAQGQFYLPERVKSLYDNHKGKQTRPSWTEISSTLQSVATLYSRVFIVVDALDECQASDGCRSRFLSEIFTLQAKCGANIFATSRFIPEIISQFSQSTSLEIRASDEDVKSYIGGQIERCMPQLQNLVSRYPQLEGDVKIGITSAVRGMFLLAQLYLGSLEDKLTPNAIRSALEDFRKQSQGSSEEEEVQLLGHVYDETMQRVNGQKEGYRKLAVTVLSWITCATRPLRASELQDALATREGKPKLDSDDFFQMDDIISVCAGLVTLDEQSSIVRLVHYTTQEYFDRTKQKWFPNAESMITTTCVTYLSFDAFESGYCETDDQFEERLESNPLYDYAAHNWGHHARKTETFHPAIRRFLTRQTNLEAANQALMAVKMLSGYNQRAPRRLTELHLTAFFGVKEVVSVLLQSCQGVDLLDSDNRTPLSWAAEQGHEAVVRLLLEKGAEIEVKDRGGRTPLAWAAWGGREAVVRLLLEKGAEIEVKGEGGRTPLSWAAARGHEAVVRLLLEKGAEIEVKDRGGRTPLAWAAGGGREAVVRLLLEKGAEIEVKDSWGRTPLAWAAARGHEVIVRLLLEKGAEVEVKDSWGRTPLAWAAAQGHEAIVRLLLEKVLRLR
ncbi:hypothetical protein MFIFM68171_03628 [Madurella fahalii]|uniref:Nucleoside phosphorylase domain-containing protein n=1 Tax=Madurella fahalii TaxID=1157608 RepID=A0ABQ0G6M7_9PEZI